MKNLGKRVVFLLLFIWSALDADVRATVDETTVELGDMVTYSLSISGEKIVRPNIQTLCGEDVISTSSQTSIEMINGSHSKTNTLSYKFIPQKSCTIEPVEVMVDGKIQKSNSVNIAVVKAKSNKDADFVLELKASKKEVYVGEPFDLTLLLKQRIDAQAVDSKFEAPKLKGFWIKGESKPQRFQNDRYVITKIVYKVAAQRVGDLNISKAKIQIAKRSGSNDIWGGWIPQIKWKTYYSNELKMSVKPLPEGVELVGNFAISVDVKKTSIEQNEALNLEVRVLGDGNLEDIKSFKPYIDGVNVFDEKIEIKGKRLTQKMAFVSDESFTVPPFKLKFFNPKTQKIQTIQTKPIYVEVKHSKKQQKLTIKRDTEVQKKLNLDSVAKKSSGASSFSLGMLVVVFLAGLVAGVVLMLKKPWQKFSQMPQKVSLKNPKKLLAKLLPYKEDKDVEKIVQMLERNIYEGENIHIDKKDIGEVLRRYSIK